MFINKIIGLLLINDIVGLLHAVLCVMILVLYSSLAGIPLSGFEQRSMV